MLLFVLIILFCMAFLIVKNKKLNKDVNELKEKLDLQNNIEKNEILEKEEKQTTEKSTEFLINCNVEAEVKNESKEKLVEKVDVIKEKKEINFENKEEILNKSNNKILTAGAILIVLSAIVFLTSTWGYIPNVLKLVLIILFIGVFLGISKIAKEKFNLLKTSKTFFDIAMAYIPIGIIAIYEFGLLGKYFSPTGNGGNLYFSISFFALAIMYYFIYRKTKLSEVLIGSFISQIICLLCICDSLKFNFEMGLLIVIGYNIILTLLAPKEKSFIVFEKILLYFSLVMFGGEMIFSQIANTTDVIDILNYSALIANFGLLNRNNRSNLLSIVFYFLTFNFVGVLIDLNNINLELILKEFFYGIWMIAILVFNLILNSNKKDLQISYIIFGIQSLYFSGNFECTIFKPWIIFFVFGVFLIIAYKKEIFVKNILKIAIPSVFLYSVTLLLSEFLVNAFAIVILGYIVFFATLFIKNEEWNKNCFKVSHFFILIAIINFIDGNNTQTISAFLVYGILGIVYLISYLKNRKMFIFKYGTYVAFVVALEVGLDLIGFNNIDLYVCAILAIIVMITETLLKNKIEDKYSDIAILLTSGLAYLTMLDGEKIPVAIYSSLITIGLIVIKNVYNKNKWFNYIGLVGNLIVITNFENLYIMSLIIGLLLMLFVLYKKEENKELTIFSIIYILDFCMSLKETIYVYLIGFIWCGAYSIFSNFKNKELQFGTCLFGWLLYNNILAKLNLNNYTSLELLGVEIFGLIFMKKVAINIWSNHEKIEYIFFGLFYIWAISNYYNVVDGVVSVGIMIAVVIFAYQNKYGSTVILNLIAIIINSISLTSEFWLAIPWWIYFGVVGMVLIAFAVKNEANENKKNLNVKNILKTIKESCEK